MRVKFYIPKKDSEGGTEVYGEVVDSVLSPMVIDHKNGDGSTVQYCVGATKYVILDDNSKQYLRFPIECVVQRAEKL